MSQRFTDACGNSLSYTLDSTNNTAMLDSGNQRYFANPVVIPSTVTYNGTTYTVTTIGGNAFFNASFLQGITIPSTVTAIYSLGFYQCYCPSSVIVIPNSVTNMSDYGIFNRSNILGCVLPSNLLDSDRTAASYKNYKGMGGGMFGQSQTISQFTFPNTLTKIPDLTFFQCGSIKTVVIPSSITYIGDRAFSGCGSMTSFVMPNTVTSLHVAAFVYGAFTSFVMSSSLTTSAVLQNCTLLPSIVLPASVTYIPDNAFAGCTALSLVTILGPLTTIGQSAFAYCTSLKSISLPATVSTINYSAFNSCTNLTSFTVPAATSSIATDNAFFNCPKLTNFSVDPSNAYYSSDSSGVLFNKAKTTLIKCPEGNVNASYKVPSTVTTIANSAFYSCKNLMTITVDSSSVTFGYLPFDSANNFKNVYFTYPTPPKITVSSLLTTAQQSTVAARYPKTTTQDASYNAVLRAAGFTSVLSYPLPQAVISAVFSDNSNNYIDISGTNFMDTATITVNGSTQPTSFNVVNNNLIVAYFQTNTQISSISVSDNFGNTSDTYQLSTPILTTKPVISSAQINSIADLTIDISGTYFNQVSGVAVNDISANIVSKSDNLITATMESLSLVKTITLYAGGVAVARQTVNLSTYPKATPVITAATVDSSSNTLLITGTSFLNLKMVEFVNVGSVYKTFNNTQFDICGNTLLRVNLTTRLKLSAMVRVTDNYNVVSNLFAPFPHIISCTCFPENTPIRTDQGLIAIDEINPEKHTIRKKTISAITQTIHPDKYLICFEKNALGNNIPCEKTIISRDHGIFYNGKMRKAKTFVNEFPNVNEVPYNGEVLYNVLMEEHDKMMVNNLICETLNPENGIAKYYRILPSLTLEEQQEFVKKVNSRVIKTSTGSSKRINN